MIKNKFIIGMLCVVRMYAGEVSFNPSTAKTRERVTIISPFMEKEEPRICKAPTMLVTQKIGECEYLVAANKAGMDIYKAPYVPYTKNDGKEHVFPFDYITSLPLSSEKDFSNIVVFNSRILISYKDGSVLSYKLIATEEKEEVLKKKSGKIPGLIKFVRSYKDKKPYLVALMKASEENGNSYIAEVGIPEEQQGDTINFSITPMIKVQNLFSENDLKQLHDIMLYRDKAAISLSRPNNELFVKMIENFKTEDPRCAQMFVNSVLWAKLSSFIFKQNAQSLTFVTIERVLQKKYAALNPVVHVLNERILVEYDGPHEGRSVDSYTFKVNESKPDRVLNLENTTHFEASEKTLTTTSSLLTILFPDGSMSQAQY